MANRLASATSPYLLQHADNPVDWYEWEPEAFAAARARDVPILLSVGYSACHWCHVMAHESFEDPETARYMNEHFVNVKVDREERPDVDRIYMDAVQATTGHGGWPMTVFLTPDGRPFFAGTYFPVDDRPGHPSFRRVMAAVQDAWAGRRDEVEDQADRLTAAVSRELPAAEEAPDREALDSAYRALVAAHDPEYGGFGAAPKFPQAPTLELLLRLATRPAEYPEAQPILEHTLAAMASGGIYDHVGGGFARYSVDRRWLVPHFEKMLYDNALLARVYLRGWQVTGAERFRTVAQETLDYILRDLALPEGGLASAEDADSEGEEGKFYVFAHDEFHDVVGAADGAAAAACFGVTPQGNFDGSNILWLAESPEAAGARLGMSEADVREAVARARGRLYAHRARRIRPARDDKVVTAWNGFAVRALAEAGAVLHRSDYLEAARRNAEFVLGEMRRPDGRLLRSWRGGSGGVPGFSEDYGAYAVGLFALYQATGERRWFAAAARLTSDLVALFADPDGPGFFAAGHDAERLIARPKEVMDNPTPSGNSLAAEALLHVYHYTGDDEARRRVEAATRLGGRLAASYPTAAGHLLAVVATAAAPPKEVVIVGDPGAERQAMVDVVWSSFRPDCFLAVADADNAAAADQIPLLGGRVPHDGPPAAYVCRRFVCELPAQSVKALKEQLSA